MTLRPALSLPLLWALCACSSSSGSGSGASASTGTSASTAVSSSPAAKPVLPIDIRPKATCDGRFKGGHVCYEYAEEGNAFEGAHDCKEIDGTFKKDGTCPTEGRTAACREPSGDVWYAYGPTDGDFEASCSEPGYKLVHGSVAPAADPPSVSACFHTDEGQCFTRRVYSKDYLPIDKKSCEMRSGKYSPGEECPTADVVTRCLIHFSYTVSYYKPRYSKERADDDCVRRVGVVVP